jgi:syntaxin 16
MASRDLTIAFMERRSAMRKRDGKKLTAGRTDDLLLVEEGGGIQMTSLTSSTDALPPQWVDDVDSINAALEDIVRMMGILQSMHSNRVGSVFGKDLDQVEGRIEKLTRDITDKFRQAERVLQRVGAATRRAGGEEATVGANVQRSLAKRLQELSMEFRQSQRKYLADVKVQKGVGLTDTESRFGIDLNETDQFSMQQMAIVDDLTEAVQSRDQEIAQIAQSIEELGSIFKELAVLVIDQGTILDRIDYNMEAVVEHTKTGIQQLERAERHQKNARPMKCIFCLMCTIGILLIILVLKHRRRRIF